MPPPTFKEPIRNMLGPDEKTRSTLAISDGELFIRTFEHLYCIKRKSDFSNSRPRRWNPKAQGRLLAHPG